MVIGEALIDLIESKADSGSYQAVVGGANANVAIALARAGTPQQLLARISSDSFGQKIRTRLESNGVGLDYAIDAPEATDPQPETASLLEFLTIPEIVAPN